MTKTLHLLVISLLVTAVSVAQADVGDWYVAPSLVHTDDDSRRAIDDSLSGGQVNVGRHMSDFLSLEGVLGYSDIRGWFSTQTHLEVGFNAIGNLAPEWAFSPYVIAGVGYLNSQTGTPDPARQFQCLYTTCLGGENRMTGTLGLGFNWKFGDSPWSLRGEYRWRNAWDSGGSLTDRLTTVGFQYSFGRKSILPIPGAAPETTSVPMLESDSDGDGVGDSQDACPRTRAGLPVDASGCPADIDFDGVTADIDLCPGTVAGVPVDANGCEIREIIELRGVYFADDDDILLPGAERVLANAAATLRMNPGLVVEIAGHTDSSGSANDNMNLSLRRAYVVRNYLVRAGVNPDNLSVRGYGESSPIASNTTEAGMAENRRVELRVLNR